jgi:hypothetical protein
MASAAIDYEAQIERDIAECYADPLRYVMLAFDWGHGDLKDWPEPDKWQIDFLTKLGERIRNRQPGEVIKIAVKTGKGPGKTALEAWLILWLNSTRPNFAGVATANTGDQLDTKLWRELSLWWQRAINKHWFQWTATRFHHAQHKDTWGMDALKWSEHKPDAFGGLHNNGRGQAVIMDEGSAIAASIYEVVDSTMTDEDSFIFVFGNPYKKRGRFYELFTRFAHRWLTVTVDCRTAKAPNQTKIQQDIEDWGLESDYVRVNVLGEFPKQDADTLIPLPLIEAAQIRVAAECERYRPIWGVDPARFGDDRTAWVIRRHRRTEGETEQWRGLDTMQIVGRLKAAWDECASDDKPTDIIVDVIGIGAGVVDRLRELAGEGKLGDTNIYGVNVSESPAVKSKFHRLRDEMYWKGREWFEGLNVECADKTIGGELADVMFSYTSAGQIKVESKDDIKERLGRSPDVGEAFLLSLIRDCQVIPDVYSDRYKRARARTGGQTAWAA